MEWPKNKISLFLDSKPFIEGQGYSYSFTAVNGEGLFCINPEEKTASVSISSNEVEVMTSYIKYTTIEVYESPPEDEPGISIVGNAGHVFIGKRGAFYSVFFNVSTNKNA